MSVLKKTRLLPPVIKSNFHIDFYQSQKVLKAKKVHCPKRMKRGKKMPITFPYSNIQRQGKQACEYWVTIIVHCIICNIQ